MAAQTVSIVRLIQLEAELARLKADDGEGRKDPLWVRLVSFLVDHWREPVRISRKKYVILALTCGWFSGAHRWYANHKAWAAVYLLTCWTGVPAALTVIDIILVLLKYRPDEEGMITV